MTSQVLAKLTALNLQLPQPAPPAANYVPWRKCGNQVFISGQLPMFNGEIQYIGKVGKDIDTQTAIKAAQLCGLNILAQLQVACEGDLDQVVSCIRLGGFVNCIDSFTEQPQVINGASQLIIDVFGEKGMHARAAIGTNALPLGVAVEVDGIFEINSV